MNVISKYQSEFLLGFVGFFLPFLFSIWQFVAADFGAELVSAYSLSDAALYHYSAWYKATFSSNSFVSDVIALSPYERLLTLIIGVFGQSNTVPFILNAFLSGLACLCITITTSILFGRKAAWVALLLFSFSAPILFFSGTTLKTLLVLCLLSSANLAAVLFLKREKNSWWLLAVFTICLIVGSIDRIHILTALVVMLLILAWPCEDKSKLRSRRRSAIVLGMIFVVCFGASSIKYGSEPKYVSSVGLNIYLGHSAPNNFSLDVDGVKNNIIGHRLDPKKVAQRALGRELDQAAVSGYWVSETLAYIKENPGSYLRGQLQKAHHLFAKISNSLVGERVDVWRSERWPLKLAFFDFGALIALFCVGVILLRRRGYSIDAVYLVVGGSSYLASVMLTIVVERYRLAVFAFMLPIAAYALTTMLSNLRLHKNLVALTGLIFAMSYLLMLTAPSKLSTNREEVRGMEISLRNGEMRGFYLLRSRLDSGTSISEVCKPLESSLKNARYVWDVSRLRRVCVNSGQL